MFTLIIIIDENKGLLLTKIWVGVMRLFSHITLHDAAQSSTEESLYNIQKCSQE